VISFVRGRIVAVDGEALVVDVGGVGLTVSVPGRVAAALSRRLDDEVTVQTYLHVREDALQLYGFGNARERALFTALIAISGVGPKVALAVLSGYPVEDLEAAVVRRDAQKFETIPGVGKKLAQRLIIELADRVAAELQEVAGGAAADDEADAFVRARQALQGLGLSLREADEALKGAPPDAPLEDLVRHALRRKTDG
jgi:Holliday junction DNA helicase RuvA